MNREDAVKQAQKIAQEAAELEKKKNILNGDKIQQQWRTYEERLEKERFLKTLDASRTTPEEVLRIQKNAEESIKNAREYGKTGVSFCNIPTLRTIIPNFSGNINLLLARSGRGKSTITANLVYTTVFNKARPGRALVITNEETAEDVLGRVAFLHRGWNYGNKMEFTEEQQEYIGKTIPALSNRIVVIDDNYRGQTSSTTSLEGITNALDKLLLEKEKDIEPYKVIVLDYYTKVKISTQYPSLNEYEVQSRLAAYLDRFKALYPAPIYVMGQLRNMSEDDESNTVEEKMYGSRAMLQSSTFVAIVKTDFEKRRTTMRVEKNRFRGDTVNKEYYMGYDKGRYVVYDTAFMERIYKEELSKLESKTTATLKKEDE